MKILRIHPVEHFKCVFLIFHDIKIFPPVTPYKVVNIIPLDCYLMHFFHFLFLFFSFFKICSHHALRLYLGVEHIFGWVVDIKKRKHCRNERHIYSYIYSIGDLHNRLSLNWNCNGSVNSNCCWKLRISIYCNIQSSKCFSPSTFHIISHIWAVSNSAHGQFEFNNNFFFSHRTFNFR